MAPNERADNKTASVEKLKPHSSFFFEDLYVAIEDTVFKIPRRDFENNSQIFCDMYTVPVPDGKPADGSSKDHPLRLSGATVDEFAQLLRVMYPSRHGERASLDPAEWEKVLKLANLWEFKFIRDIAVHKLQPTIDSMTPQCAIVMARKYDVGKWLVDAVDTMARRDEPIGVTDAEILGVECALQVAHVREMALNILNPNATRSWMEWRSRSSINFRPVIQRIFNVTDSI